MQATSPYQHDPVHGRVTAVLAADAHEQFWKQLVSTADPHPGEERPLTRRDLASAWAAMPLTVDGPAPPQ